MKQQPHKQAGRAGQQAESSKRKTIESAVAKFLKNKKADGVDEGTYYNQDLARRKQFLGWAKNKSLVDLDEITLEDLEDFRATLPGNAVTRPYKQSLLRGFFRYCAAAVRLTAANYYRRQGTECPPAGFHRLLQLEWLADR